MRGKIERVILVPGLVIIFACVLLQPGAASAEAVPASADRVPTGPAALSDPEDVEAFLDESLATQMAENHIPGAMVAVVLDGQVVLTKGYGYADLEKQTPVDPQRTLFRVASVSKLLAWTAVMQLVEQGKLSMDIDINEYLDFTIPDTYPEPITLRHLMSHTPGFEEKNMGMFKLEEEQAGTLRSWLVEEMPARVFPPGQIIAYSNYGATLAAYMVELQSGQSFNDYVEQNILEPLGMTRSSFRQPLPANLMADLAKGYNYTGDQYVPGTFIFDQAYPSGSLSATAADMARFMIAHLQNGELDGQRILEEETARQMHTRLYAADPRLDGVAYGFFEKTLNGQRLISHGGNLLNYQSFLYLIPEQNAGFFISTNGTSGGAVIQSIVPSLVDYLYPVPETPTPKAAAGFEERFAPFLGSYTSARGNFNSFEKMISLFGPLSASMGGDGTVIFSTKPYVEVEPGLLQGVEDPDNRAVYRTDAAGRRLVTGSPSVYEPSTMFRTAWYGTAGLHLAIAACASLLFLGAMIVWPIKYVYGRLRGTATQRASLSARAARWTAALFGLLLIATSVAMVVVFTDILPGFGVARVVFGMTPVLRVALLLSWVAGVLALAILVLAVLAWVRRTWTPAGRIFYSLLALSALLLTWSLAYWDLIL
jgi:CubicO group peptidase (beta-lactamase class C family)